MTPPTGDPVIDEIREIRHRISARFDHDPVKLVAYYMKLQERHAHRFWKPTGPVGPITPAERLETVESVTEVATVTG